MIPEKTGTGREAYVPHSGGAVFNTAIALGRLGRPVSLLSGVSTDLFGMQLQAALKASHVDDRYLVLSDRPTTLAFVKLENGHAKYAFYDESTAGRLLGTEALPDLSEDISALFFGGISLACEPCADTYQEVLARAHQTRAIVMDPNIRPGFAPNADRYRARLMDMLSHADLVKVSDEDLAWIIPDQQGLAAQAVALQAMGPSVVLVTRGAEGALGVLPDGQCIEIPAEPAIVADTVGAGDTFNAGVMARLDELGLLTKPALHSLPADALRQALTHGAKVAAITVARPGANPPWATEL